MEIPFTSPNHFSSLFLLGVITFNMMVSSRSQPAVHEKHHKCVHEKVAIRDLPIINAAVDLYSREHRLSRSAEVINDKHHKRSSPPQFTRVRITPYFIEPLDASLRDKLTHPAGALMKAINTMSSLLLVRQLRDNLTLTPSCRETFNSRSANQGKCMELNSRTECGIFTVPAQFVGTTLVCDSANNTSACHEEGPGGLGLATDFLAFIGTDGQQSNCGSGTFAFSSSCAKDAYHRPTVGYINLCSEQFLSSSEVEGGDDTILYNILLHELVHALGFSRHRLVDFHDGNLNFYDPRVTATYSGNEFTGIRSPKVLETGRSYFACSDLPYVPLENGGEDPAINSHWEARVLHHESMVAFVSKDYSVLSNFTLSYFEDSGWYKVNYSSLGDMNQLDLLWGKGLGCPFVLEQCTKYTYPYLCNTSRTFQCTFDLVSRGKCTDNSRYFDGCAVVIPESVGSSCLYQGSKAVHNAALEVYGHGSMCVDIGPTTSSSSVMDSFPFCYSYQYFSNSSSPMQHDVQIIAYNETVRCNSSTVEKTSHVLQQMNRGGLKVYCPCRNQLNVRLALAGLAEYKADIDNTPSKPGEETEPQDIHSSSWVGILITIIAVLVVTLAFGIPLLLISVKVLDCGRGQQDERRYEPNDPNVVSISRTSSNLTEIVVV